MLVWRVGPQSARSRARQSNQSAGLEKNCAKAKAQLGSVRLLRIQWSSKISNIQASKTRISRQWNLEP